MKNSIKQVIKDFLNYIGGTLRFVFGTIYRMFFKMEIHSLKEYLNGYQQTQIEKYEHQKDNEFIAVIFLAFISFLYIVVF